MQTKPPAQPLGDSLNAMPSSRVDAQSKGGGSGERGRSGAYVRYALKEGPIRLPRSRADEGAADKVDDLHQGIHDSNVVV